MTQPQNPGLLAEITASFRALPTWVIAWVFLILAPVNAASLAFLGQPSGAYVALFAIGGGVISLAIAIKSRGLTRLVSAGHIIAWTPLLLWLVLAPPPAEGAYDTYLTILIVVNAISLAFDVNDARLWLRGDRSVYA